MAIQTKQQKRAKFALNELKDKVSKNEVDSKLATFIVGMPNMILSNGIGQSMAFLMAKAKSKPERKFVFYTIKKYLCQNYASVFGTFKQDDAQDDYNFLKKFNEVPQNEYIKMQDEVLRMLEWLKRYARAFETESKEKSSGE